MDKQYVFEYAVLRVVPQVEREEFINVGVVLFSKELNFLSVKIKLNVDRLISLSPLANIQNIDDNLNAFNNIAKGLSAGGPIAQYIASERFRWLTATRSTVVQCSKIHPGICGNPEMKLEQLFSEYVEIQTQ